ncbi:MAG: hypothetical protein ACOC2U_01240 [bacterium]
MKKIIISSIAGIVIIGLSFLNIDLNNHKNGESGSLLALNQKAFADCEIVGEIEGDFYVHFYSECHWECYAGGYFNCPI